MQAILKIPNTGIRKILYPKRQFRVTAEALELGCKNLRAVNTMAKKPLPKTILLAADLIH